MNIPSILIIIAIIIHEGLSIDQTMSLFIYRLLRAVFDSQLN